MTGKNVLYLSFKLVLNFSHASMDGVGGGMEEATVTGDRAQCPLANGVEFVVRLGAG